MNQEQIEERKKDFKKRREELKRKRDEDIIQMRINNYGYREIKNKYNISDSTIVRVLKDNNFCENNTEKVQNGELKEQDNQELRIDSEEDIIEILKSFIKKGKLKDAREFMDSVINSGENNAINQEQLQKLNAFFNEYEIKIRVIELLRNKVDISDIALQLGISVIQVIKIKHEWKYRELPCTGTILQDDKKGMGIGD